MSNLSGRLQCISFLVPATASLTVSSIYQHRLRLVLAASLAGGKLAGQIGQHERHDTFCDRMNLGQGLGKHKLA